MHTWQQRHARPVQTHRSASASCQLQGMACQAKTSHIGHRMHPIDGRQHRAGGVQLRGHRQHLGIALGGELLFFKQRRQHAHANGFAQNQTVAHLGIGIALDPRRVHQTQSHQAVNGLHRIDGVAPGHHNACGFAHRVAAFQNAPDHLGAEHIDGHAHQGQGHDGRAPHGIHIAQGIGGRNAAKVHRVVHDGHEKIGGGDQGLLVVEQINRRIIGRGNAHQYFRRHDHGGGALQNFAQDPWCDLATATTPMRERCQTG